MGCATSTEKSPTTQLPKNPKLTRRIASPVLDAARCAIVWSSASKIECGKPSPFERSVIACLEPKPEVLLAAVDFVGATVEFFSLHDQFKHRYTMGNLGKRGGTPRYDNLPSVICSVRVGGCAALVVGDHHCSIKVIDANDFDVVMKFIDGGKHGGRSLAAVCATSESCFAATFSFSDCMLEFCAITGELLRRVEVPEPTGILHCEDNVTLIASMSSQKKLFRILPGEATAQELDWCVHYVSALAWINRREGVFVALHKYEPPRPASAEKAHPLGTDAQAISIFRVSRLGEAERTAVLPFSEPAGKILVLPDGRFVVGVGKLGVRIFRLVGGAEGIEIDHCIDGLMCAGGLALVPLKL